MKRIILVCCFLQMMTISSVFAQSEKSFLRQGNKNYNKKNFSEAEISYRKALAQDSTYAKAAYNLANTMYKQKQFKVANLYYQQLLNENKLPADMQSKIHYNMGNTYLQQGLNDMKKGDEKYVESLKKSIESYKNSIRLNPADSNAKYNLAYTMRFLPKPQENKSGGGGDGNDKDKQQDQQQNQNQKGKEDQSDQQQQQQQQKNQAKEQQSKETERILQALEDNEKKTLEKQKVKIKGKQTEKDW